MRATVAIDALVEQARRALVALVIDRNVLEWRLDPTSPHHVPEMTDVDRRVIIVCHQGYSSSLAAATLRQLGLRRATDLDGGFQAWANWSRFDNSRDDSEVRGRRG